jgi:hypothetical protein
MRTASPTAGFVGDLWKQIRAFRTKTFSRWFRIG